MIFSRVAYARHLGRAGLYLFAFSGFVNQGGVYAGLVLMLLGLLMVPDLAWQSLRRQPLMIPPLVLTGYILLSSIAAWMAWPTGNTLPDAWNLVSIGGLFALLAGWWLDGNDRRVALVLQLAVLGLLVGILKDIGYEYFITYMSRRPLFGMGNGAGLYSLIALLGLFLLRGAGLFEGGWQRRLPSAAVKLSLMLLFAVFSVVFLLSQTRAAWLAALIVLPAMLVVLVLHRAGRRQKRWVTGFEVLVLGIFVAGVTLQADTIEKRLGAEQGTLVKLFSGQIRDLPSDSVGLRVRLWDNAVQHMAERPLLGWGAGSARQLIGEAGDFGELSHYHNLYLQLGVELGLVGLGLFAWWLLALVRAALCAWRERRVEFDYLLFLAASLAVFLIVSCFQLRHDDERGQYMLILAGALALTYRLGGKPALSSPASS